MFAGEPGSERTETLLGRAVGVSTGHSDQRMRLHSLCGSKPALDPLPSLGLAETECVTVARAPGSSLVGSGSEPSPER